MSKNLNEKTYRNNEQDRRIALIEEHIVIYNKEMGDVRTDLAIVKTDTAWLKRFFWIVAVSSISGLATGIINLLLNSSFK